MRVESKGTTKGDVDLAPPTNSLFTYFLGAWAEIVHKCSISRPPERIFTIGQSQSLRIRLFYVYMCTVCLIACMATIIVRIFAGLKIGA